MNNIISKCKKSGKLVFADSQSSSQVGDICRFNNMDFISATEREARISLQNSQDGLVVLAEKLKSRSEADNIFLKLGTQGVLLYLKSNTGNDEFITDRLLSLNNSPKDTAGAGDAMFITAALSFAVEKNPFIAACMGNIASAIQVGRMGNVPLTLEEFTKALDL